MTLPDNLVPAYLSGQLVSFAIPDRPTYDAYLQQAIGCATVYRTAIAGNFLVYIRHGNTALTNAAPPAKYCIVDYPATGGNYIQSIAFIQSVLDPTWETLRGWAWQTAGITVEGKGMNYMQPHAAM